MSVEKTLADLTQQMILDNSTRKGGLTGEARVLHENGSPESRARMATLKFEQVEEEMKASKALEDDAAFAARHFAEGHEINTSMCMINKSITFDETILRAALRNAYNKGFRAGWKIRHKRPTL